MKLLTCIVLLTIIGFQEIELDGFGFKVVVNLPTTNYTYSTHSFVEGMAYNYIFERDTSAISIECISNRIKKSKSLNLISTDTLMQDNNRIIRSYGYEEDSLHYWQQDLYLDINLVINCWNIREESLENYYKFLVETQINT